MGRGGRGEAGTVPEKQHLRSPSGLHRGHGEKRYKNAKGGGIRRHKSRRRGNKGIKQHSRTGGKAGMLLRVTANCSRAELGSMSAGMASSGNVKTRPWDALLIFAVLVQWQILSLDMM